MRTTYRLLALTLVAGAAAATAQQPTPAPQPSQGQPRQGPPPQARGMAPGGRRMAPTPNGPETGQMGPAGPQMMGAPMGPGGGIASMLLAHTAELKLTDQQLSKLAAIARRTEDRHKAMRASMDSLMRTNRPQPGAAPTQPSAMMMSDQNGAMMDRMHEQERTDLRDALAVLTVDQQADAWMMREAGARMTRRAQPSMMGAPHTRRPQE
ncbi:hypothetical protein BH09GEM1_BH09GEM1_33930 [soil metagenome]